MWITSFEAQHLSLYSFGGPSLFAPFNNFVSPTPVKNVKYVVSILWNAVKAYHQSASKQCQWGENGNILDSVITFLVAQELVSILRI